MASIRLPVVIAVLFIFYTILAPTAWAGQKKAFVQTLEQHNPRLNPAALRAGIRAYRHLRRLGKDCQHILTIVDFSKPANQKRLYVINMATGHLDSFTYVAQGTATGLNRAVYFSNQVGSHASSIGVYLTGQTYHGIAGLSLRLHGLDKGFNNHAFQRHIVIHPEKSVSVAFIQKHGELGHSYGCFGLNPKVSQRIIAEVKNGTVWVAYAPNPQWLASSPYEQPLT